jgi:arginyl-tRNA synthetase
MLDIKQKIAEILNEMIESMDTAQIQAMLESPADSNLGDFALPCFKLSKVLRKAPMQIAQDLLEKLPKSEYIERAEAVSGYLNLFVSKPIFSSEVVGGILEEGEKYGSRDIGKGRKVVIDYSAPNIAKPFHIGHLRSTVIGNSIYRIFKFMGYNSVGVNHLGDWGTQFGKLIVAYKNWGSKEKVEQDQIKELLALYVKFHEEAEKKPELGDEARSWFARLEQGDAEAQELWKWFRDISLREFEKVYKILDVQFDSYAGEAFYNDKMDVTIEELKTKELLKESEGAQIVDLSEYNMPPCIILKKDGSTLYATRDITAALYRKKTYDFEKAIYVTGAAQSLHFAQWFKVVEMMGYDWSKDLVHVPFGLVSVGGEKLSTRKGMMVMLEDILSEAIKKTLEIIQEKSPHMQNKEETARQIGVGAVVFSDLSANRIKDVSFSWEEVLNFEGETGPYVQYTHARTCSVLAKSGREVNSGFDGNLLASKEEYLLIKTLYQFPARAMQAMNDLEPSVITRYLVDLAQDFNRFYHECPILVEDISLQEARLALVKAVRTTLANGLRLIGLSAPERV